VGFITYNLFERKKLGVIGNNAIHPNYQGKGLGTKQYQRVLEIFRENGMLYAGVTTGSDESHAPARAGYEKVGFRPMIHIVQYYRKL
jgi:GNAT superfamily N-acetyltransferase